MSVVSGDIKVYGSTNMQESDTGAQGGTIDITTLALFDNAALANTPGGAISILSTLAGDTAAVTVTGRNTGGSIIGESITLAGVNAVTGLLSFERLLKVIALTHDGIITVRDTGLVTIVDIPSGVSYIRRPFYDVSSDIAGGSERKYYEKVFIKNTNASNSLLGATITEVTGGAATSMAFAIESGYNGTGTVINRRTTPTTNVGTFGDGPTTVFGTDLPAGSGIGTWLELTLAAGAAASKTTYTISVSGSTT